MSERTVISCDVCKRDQATVNHWWCVWVEKGIYHACSTKDRPSRKRAKHACGNDHETVLHNRWLTTGSLEIEMHPEPAARPVGLKQEDLGCPAAVVEQVTVEAVDDVPPMPE